MKNTITESNVRDTLMEAYRSAIHHDQMEYRICLDQDEELCIDERPEGDSMHYEGWCTLKTYCMWPSVLDYLGPEGTGSEEDLQWLFDEFVSNVLDDDVDEVMRAIEELEADDIRSRLLAIRGDRSQAKAASDYHIPLRTWEDWERGIRRPPKYVLLMLEEQKKREA